MRGVLHPSTLNPKAAAPKEHRHPSLVKAPVQFTLTRERWVVGTPAADRVGVDCSTVLRREKVAEERELY